jgi:apolipoprotein N-acyltransferase
MKLSRPSPFALICLAIAVFIFAVDVSEILTQSLVVIPIYHTGILYFLWSDYVEITMPVGFVWLALSYGFWNPGGTT